MNMKKFEYKVHAIKVKGWFSRNIPEEAIKEINSLGDQGWELTTSSEIIVSQGQTKEIILFFKRENKIASNTM